MLYNHFKIALRNLWKNKVHSIINIGGLAIGLAACMAIGLYVHHEWSYDRFHRHFGQIYRLTEIQKQADGMHPVCVTPGPLATALCGDFPEVEQTLRIGQWPALLQREGVSIESKNTLIAEPSLFKMFDFTLLHGHPDAVLNSPDEIVLTESSAERLFGADWRNEAVLGSILTLNTDKPLKVTGVAANPPANSHLQFDVLLPFKFLEKYDEWSNKWNSNSYHTYLQLASTADASAFGEKIVRYLDKHQAGNETTLHLQPLQDIYLYSKFDFGTDWGKRGNALYLRIFGMVGLIVLLIAMVNFVNLATARAALRAHEVGVRKSVGASRSSLMGQFLSESLLMTTLAVGLALVISDATLGLLERLTGETLQIPFEQPTFWALMAGLTVVIGLLTGAYPAVFLSALRPAKVLKGVFDVRSGATFRQMLVVGQFALSVALGIGTVVIYRQLDYWQHKNLGFDQSQLLYVQLKGEARGKAASFKEALQQIPGVASVSATTNNLVNALNSSNIEWEGQQHGQELLITQMNADPDFLNTMGMTVAAGRSFSSDVANDTLAFLLNETAARRMGYTNESALGKKMKFWGLDGTVVGVLRDFHFRPLSTEIEPFIVRYRPKEFYFQILIKTEPNATASTIASIEKLYPKIDPANPLTYGFVDQDLDAQYRAERRMAETILSFSILAVLVSCLGLFGLAAFAAERRTKEIGIRKVLGASVTGITGLLAKDFLKLVVASFVIAFPVAYFVMDKWLQDFAYRIDIQWWMFLVAGAAAVAVAFLTVSFQSIKAALANPVKSLRSE